MQRKRLLQSSTKKNKRRKSGVQMYNTIPTRILAGQRVGQFQNETFRVAKGSLFCSACQHEVKVKTSIIKAHIASAKHIKNKEMLVSQKSSQAIISDFLKNNPIDREGIHLSEEHKVFRIKTLQAFFRCGIPINKINCMRDFFKEYTPYSLTDRSHMTKLIPTVYKLETERLISVLKGKMLGLVLTV